MAMISKITCGLINIQSVGNKTNKIKSLIEELNLDVLILTETWLSNDISDSSKIKEMIPKSHNFYHIPRENRSGGGVGVLIKKTFTKVKVMNVESFESFEYIDTKITSDNKNIRIITVYRPPNKSKSRFIEEMSDFLDTIDDTSDLVLCGDFNLHFDNPKDNYVNKFKDILDNHELINNVNAPTSKSNHIIDLIIHNKSKKITKKIEIEPECTISPVHKLITFEIDIKKSAAIRKKITYRNRKNFNAENFINECINDVSKMTIKCECKKSQEKQEEQRCVSCYTAISKKIMSNKYDEKCPEIEKLITSREKAKWYNKDLNEAKKLRRKLEDKWKRHRSLENWNSYKAIRNRYNMLVEDNKKKYYKETFKKSKNPKEIHKNLEELLGLKKEKVFTKLARRS